MSACVICSTARVRPLNIEAKGSSLLRCQECRAVYWDRVWNGRELVTHYHDYYSSQASDCHPITERRYHAMLDRFERLTPPGPLLEIGCGMGHFLAVAESRHWKPVGLEISQSGRERLERLKAARGWNFPVHGVDVMEATFPPGSFRAVVLIEVLEHVASPMACLRRIHTWLEQGGLLYLTTPNFDSLSRYLLGGQWRVIASEHLCLFNPRTLRASLRAAGFRPVRFVTKNVDVPEILAKLRRRAPREPVSTSAATQELRQTLEASPWLRVLKAGANAALRVSGWGETLDVLALKP